MRYKHDVLEFRHLCWETTTTIIIGVDKYALSIWSEKLNIFWRLIEIQG